MLLRLYSMPCRPAPAITQDRSAFSLLLLFTGGTVSLCSQLLCIAEHHRLAVHTMALPTPRLFAYIICPAGAHLQYSEIDQVPKEGDSACCICLLQLSPAFAACCSVSYSTPIRIVHSASSRAPCLTASMDCLASPHLRLALGCEHLIADQAVLNCSSRVCSQLLSVAQHGVLIVHFFPLAPSGCLYEMSCRS